MLALEQRGLGILIVSLRHPTDRNVHPMHAAIRAERLYLPEYLYQEPLRVWRGWRQMRRSKVIPRAASVWLADLLRDPTPNRVRRFGQALVLAAELPADIQHLHAHFLHTPASVARYTALISGRGWSVSAHAKDIWTTPEWEKREKLGEAQWAVTCTAAGHAHLAALAPRPERITLCYHGLDLERFSHRRRAVGGATGAMPSPGQCCFPSVAPWQKRVTTICSPRWRCCRPIWRGDLCISVAGIRGGLAKASRASWSIRPDRMAGRLCAARSACCLSRGRFVRPCRQNCHRW